VKDFVQLMHHDAVDVAMANDDERWSSCFSSLHASGRFDGRSSIGSDRVRAPGQGHDAHAHIARRRGEHYVRDRQGD
jgi:hypothetical protein